MSPIDLRRVKLALICIGAVGIAGASLAPGHAADTAEIYVVQGLPDSNLDVSIDGTSVSRDVATTKVAGPFDVEAGRRVVTFSEGDDVVLRRTLTVDAGSSSDVVVHLPVSASDDPRVTVFENDLSAAPRGKATLAVAHTAAVPPADIRVDGKVLFANVANGEALTLVVPAGTYSVDIVPTGEDGPAVLGPMDLEVKAGGLQRVFAVGDPSDKTMNVAVHVIKTGTTGSSEPSKVNTGTGGQAVGHRTPLGSAFLR